MRACEPLSTAPSRCQLEDVSNSLPGISPPGLCYTKLEVKFSVPFFSLNDLLSRTALHRLVHAASTAMVISFQVRLVFCNIEFDVIGFLLCSD